MTFRLMSGPWGSVRCEAVFDPRLCLWCVVTRVNGIDRPEETFFGLDKADAIELASERVVERSAELQSNFERVFKGRINAGHPWADRQFR